MMISVVRPASTTASIDNLAELLWSTDPKLNTFMFRDNSTLLKILGREWPSKEGLLSHNQAFVAGDGADFHGVLIGHTAHEYAKNFEASVRLQTEPLENDEAAHLEAALKWMDRLFPAPPDRSHYILEFAISRSARGAGLAAQFMRAAEQRARRSGCKRLCPDVAADNEAVGFYKHIGFEVEIETRVPFLHEKHGIGLHFQMVRNLDDLS